MYKVGEYVVYGNVGVCKVGQVGPLSTSGSKKDRIYYTLIPVYTKDSKIFTPADNQKVIIRPVMKKDEALELIDDIKEIENLSFDDEKKREETYKQVLRQCDCHELIKMIKTLYSRIQARIAVGKKVTASEEKYFKKAEETLYEELAISLAMDREKVKEYVINRIEQQL